MSRFEINKRRKWGQLKTQYYDEVIRLYFEYHYGYKRIAKILPVGRTTALEWIHEYLKIHPELNSDMEEMESRKDKGSQSKSSVSRNGSDSKEVEALKKRIKELERQLYDKSVTADIYDEMINIAERRFGIEIRKKPGTK